ncbi:MAG: hypothetical protein JXA99_12065 [Candidatus Lokiarchaeota archaeon]|nr:hypothetical protein [Candidatus Lokiarchaeota archaeon]
MSRRLKIKKCANNTWFQNASVQASAFFCFRQRDNAGWSGKNHLCLPFENSIVSCS